MMQRLVALRWNLIIASTVLFTATSILCAISSAGRLAAARFGSLAAVGLVAPVVGPVIGGGLLRFSDWRTVFWFLAVVGAAMILAALYGLPETLLADQRRPGGIRLIGLTGA